MSSKNKIALITAALAVCLLAAVGSASAQSVTVVHAAPFAENIEETSVDVFVNGNLVLTDTRFGEFAELQAGGAPQIDVEVVPVGAEDPVISGTVELGENVTILAVGDGTRQDLSLLRLSDSVEEPDEGNLNLRVVHAAPFAADPADTEVSIRTAAGVVVNNLAGVVLGQASGFFQLPAGTADLKVASPDGSTNLIDPLPAELPAGANVTVIAIGNGDQQPLGILALPIGLLPTRAPVDVSVTGWWDTSNSANEGVVLQPIPAENRLVGSIYTYDPEGSGAPHWFTFDSCQQTDIDSGCPMPGNFDGIATTGSVFECNGGQFGDGTDATCEVAGMISIEFLDCSTGVATIELDSGATLDWQLRRAVAETVECTLPDTVEDEQASDKG